MTDSEEVARVAQRLTKAQRTRLRDVAELRGLGVSWCSAHGSLSARAARASTRHLIDTRLLAVDDCGDCMLTPFGEAVRALLADRGGA